MSRALRPTARTRLLRSRTEFVVRRLTQERPWRKPGPLPFQVMLIRSLPVHLDVHRGEHDRLLAAEVVERCRAVRRPTGPGRRREHECLGPRPRVARVEALRTSSRLAAPLGGGADQTIENGVRDDREAVRAFGTLALEELKRTPSNARAATFNELFRP